MKKSEKPLLALQVILLMIVILSLSSCRWGQEIVFVEVAQLPYKMVYVAGTADSLDMEGCIIRIHTRDKQVEEGLFVSEIFAYATHEIDFSTPGEYDVRLYWGRRDFEYANPNVPTRTRQSRYIYTMTIQVVAPD